MNISQRLQDLNDQKQKLETAIRSCSDCVDKLNYCSKDTANQVFNEAIKFINTVDDNY